MDDQLEQSHYWRMVPDYVWKHPDLIGTDLQVWCALMSFANEKRRCWPTQKALAKRAGIGQSTVERSLTRLRDAGAVTSRPHPKYDSLIYTLWMAGPQVPNLETPSLTNEGPPSPADEGPPPSLVRDRTRASERDPLTTSADASESVENPPTQPDVFQALINVCGHDIDQLTKTERAIIGSCANQLLPVLDNVDEVAARAREYAKRWPDAHLTPPALVKHWSALKPKQRTRRPTSPAHRLVTFD